MKFKDGVLIEFGVLAVMIILFFIFTPVLDRLTIMIVDWCFNRMKGEEVGESVLEDLNEFEDDTTQLDKDNSK